MACTIDFRCLDEGLGGQNSHKRKRSTENDDGGVLSMEIDDVPTSKRSAVPSADDPDRPTFGKPTYDGVIAGKVSGRKWKQPRRERASSVKVSHKGTTFEQRARTKEIKKAYKERMNELKEEIKANKVEKRKRREEREKRKKENILRSGTKLQKITNPKTLKKIAKSKQKKLLKVVPDDLLKKRGQTRASLCHQKELVVAQKPKDETHRLRGSKGGAASALEKQFMFPALLEFIPTSRCRENAKAIFLLKPDREFQAG